LVLARAGFVSFDLVGLGPDGVVGVEWFDDGAVGFDEVDASVFVAASAELFAVFPYVVGVAEWE